MSPGTTRRCRSPRRTRTAWRNAPTRAEAPSSSGRRCFERASTRAVDRSRWTIRTQTPGGSCVASASIGGYAGGDGRGGGGGATRGVRGVGSSTFAPIGFGAGDLVVDGRAALDTRETRLHFAHERIIGCGGRVGGGGCGERDAGLGRVRVARFGTRIRGESGRFAREAGRGSRVRGRVPAEGGFARGRDRVGGGAYLEGEGNGAWGVQATGRAVGEGRSRKRRDGTNGSGARRRGTRRGRRSRGRTRSW